MLDHCSLPFHRDATPMLLRILDDEKLFRNGSPHWTELRDKPNERPCENARMAKSRREDTVALLRRHGHQNDKALLLANRLEGCAPGARCMSGACPQCGRALQRWFVSATTDLIDRHFVDREDLWLASVVPDYCATPVDALEAFDWPSLMKKTRKILRSSGVEFAVGGADFSVNETSGDPDSKWAQGQIWMLLSTPRGVWESEVKSLINASGMIKRPLKLTRFNGDPAGLAYAFKTTFARRISYHAEYAARQDRQGSANTRDRLLRGESWLALMIFLDRIGLDARLFKLGAKRTAARTGVTINLIDGG